MITLLKNARILSFKNDEIIEGDIAVTDNKISLNRSLRHLCHVA